MKILIVEDESIAAQQLEDVLRSLDFKIASIEKAASVSEAVEWLSNNKADLLFLDIQLGDGTSFDIFDKLKIETPAIFTTAYDQYAIKAFKLNSIDYLLKPVKKEELAAAIEKFTKLSATSFPDIKRLIESLQAEKKEYKKRFIIQVGMTIQSIETGDIAFFYAMDKSVFLSTFKRNMLTVDYTLDKLETILDPEQFFRINRKLIININAISKMESWSRSRVLIELSPPPPKTIEPIVSIERASSFKNWLDR